MAKVLDGSIYSNDKSKTLLNYDPGRGHYVNTSLTAYIASVTAGSGITPNTDSNNTPQGVIDQQTITVLIASKITTSSLTTTQQLLVGTTVITPQSITTQNSDLNLIVDAPYSINLQGSVTINGTSLTGLFGLFNLTDVNIVPANLIQGQMLYYDGTTAKWIPTTPVNLSFLQNIDTSNVSSANNVLIYNISTGLWSASQLQTSDIFGLNAAILNSLFIHNLLDVNVTARSSLYPFIKFDEISDLFVSAQIVIDDIIGLQALLDTKMNVTSPLKLLTLSDVNGTGIQDGYILVYNSLTGIFTPRRAIINIEDLGHTLINSSNEIDKYVLKYNGAQGLWTSAQLEIGDVYDLTNILNSKVNVTHNYVLGDLSNISLTGLMDGDTIAYNSTLGIWKPYPLAGIQSIGQIPDVDTTGTGSITITPKLLIYNDIIHNWEAKQITEAMVVNLVYDLSQKASVVHNHTLESLVNMSMGSRVDGDTIIYENGVWKPIPFSGINSLNDIPGVNVTAQSLINDFFKYDGTTWRAYPINISDVTNLQNTLDNMSHPLLSINDLTDVNTSGAGNGYALVYSTVISKWIAQSPGSVATLGVIGDVNDTGKSNGKVLMYNGTKWTPVTLSESNITNLVTDLSQKAPLIHYHNISNLLDVSFVGTPSANSILSFSGTLGKWTNKILQISDINFLTSQLANKAPLIHTHLLGALQNVSTLGAISGSVLGYNGTMWIPQAPSGISSIGQIPDVYLPGPLLNGQVLGYNSTTHKWVATAPPGIYSLSQIPDVHVTGILPNNLLGWNGTNWVPYSPTGIQSIGEIPDVDTTNKSSSNNVLIYNSTTHKWTAGGLSLDAFYLLRENTTKILEEQQVNTIQTSNVIPTKQFRIDYMKNSNIINTLAFNTLIYNYECNYIISDDLSNLEVAPHEVIYNKVINNSNYFPIIINLYLNISSVFNVFKLVVQNYESSPKEIQIWGHNKTYGSPDNFNFINDGSGTLLINDTLNITNATSYYEYVKNTLNTASFLTYGLVILSKQTNNTIFVNFSYFTLVPTTLNVQRDRDYHIVTGTDGYPNILNISPSTMNYNIDLTKLVIQEMFRRVFPTIYSPTEIHIGNIILDGTSNKITGLTSTNITNPQDIVTKDYVDVQFALKSPITHNHNLDNLLNVNITIPKTIGSLLSWDGSYWNVSAPSGLTSIGQIPDVDTSGKSFFNNILVYDPISTKWIATSYGINQIPDLINILNNKIDIGTDSLQQLSDVLLTLPVQSKQILTFNGTNWINKIISLSYLNDVDISSSLIDRNVLVYDSTLGLWKGTKIQISDIDNLQGELDGKIPVGYNLLLKNLIDVNAIGITNGQVLQYQNGTWIPINLQGITGLDSIPFVTTVNKSSTNNILKYNTTTLFWEASRLTITDVNNLQTTLGTLMPISGYNIALSSLSDVNVSSVISGDLLAFNGTKWVPSSPSGLSSIGQIPDVDTAGVIMGDTFIYNGTKWTATYMSTNVINDFDVTSATNVNNILKYFDGKWYANQLKISDILNLQTTLNNKFDISTTFILDQLTNVRITNPIANDFLIFNGTSWSNLHFNPAGLTSIGQLPDVDILYKSINNDFLKYIPSTNKWTASPIEINDVHLLNNQIDVVVNKKMQLITTFNIDYIGIQPSYSMVNAYFGNSIPNSYNISKGTYTVVNNTGLGLTCLWYTGTTTTYINFTETFPFSLRINYSFFTQKNVAIIGIKSDVAPNNINSISIYGFTVSPLVTDNSVPPTGGILLLTATSATYDFSNLVELMIQPEFSCSYLAFIIDKTSGTSLNLKTLYVKSENKTNPQKTLNVNYTISTDPTTGYPLFTNNDTILDTWHIDYTKIYMYELQRRIFPVIRDVSHIIVGDIFISSVGANSNITGLTAPLLPNDAVNKFYADGIVGNHILDDLSDVNVTSVVNNNILKYFNGNWIAANNTISSLFDVDLALLSSINNVLKYNILTSKWDALQLQISDINNLQTLLNSYAISGQIALNSLIDIDLTGLTNNQLLGYNSTINKWIPFSISGLSSIGYIPDVDITNKSATNNLLKYIPATGKWTASPIEVSDFADFSNNFYLYKLLDVTITTPTDNQILTFYNNKWNNSSLFHSLSINTTPFTIISSNVIYNVDTSSNNIIILLPLIPELNCYIFIKDIFGNALQNNITIDGNGYNINDKHFYNLESNNESVLLYFNGTIWITLAKFYDESNIINNITDVPLLITFNENNMIMCNSETLTINISSFSFNPAYSIVSGSINNLLNNITSDNITVDAQTFYRINYKYVISINPTYFTFVTSFTNISLPIDFTLNIYASNTTININDATNDFTGMTLILTSNSSAQINISNSYKYWSVEIIYADVTSVKLIYEASFVLKIGTPHPMKTTNNEFTLTTDQTSGLPLFTKMDSTLQDVKFNIYNISSHELFRRIYPTIKNPGQISLNNTIVTTTPYNVVYTDSILLVDTTTNTITINLISTPINGMFIYICDYKGNASNHHIIINGNSYLINDSVSSTMNTNYRAVNLYFDGTKWHDFLFQSSLFLKTLGDVSLNNLILNNSILTYSTVDNKWHDIPSSPSSYKNIIASYSDTLLITADLNGYVNIGYVVVYTTIYNITITFPESPIIGTRIVIKDYDGNASTNFIYIFPSGIDKINYAANNVMNVNNLSREFVYSDGNNWIPNNLENNNIYINTTDTDVFIYVTKPLDLFLPITIPNTTSIYIKDATGTAGLNTINIYTDITATVDNYESIAIDTNYGYVDLYFYDSVWYVKNDKKKYLINYLDNVVQNSNSVINYGNYNSSTLDDSFGPFVFNKNVNNTIIFPSLDYNLTSTINASINTNLQNIIVQTPIKDSFSSGNIAFQIPSSTFRININYGEQHIFNGVSYRMQTARISANIKKMRVYASHDAIDMSDLTTTITNMELLIDFNGTTYETLIQNNKTDIQYFVINNVNPFQYISFVIYENNGYSTTGIGHIGMYTAILGSLYPITIKSNVINVSTDSISGYPIVTKNTINTESFQVDIPAISTYELFRRIFPVVRSNGEIQLKNTNKVGSGGDFTIVEFNDKLYISFGSIYLFGIDNLGNTFIYNQIDTDSNITFESNDVTSIISCGVYNLITTSEYFIFQYNNTKNVFCINATGTVIAGSIQSLSDVVDLSGTINSVLNYGNFSIINIDTYIIIRYLNDNIFNLDSNGNIHTLSLSQTNNIVYDLSSYVQYILISVFAFYTFNNKLIFSCNGVEILELSNGTLYTNFDIIENTNINRTLNITLTNSYKIGNFTFVSAGSFILLIYNNKNILQIYNNGLIQSSGSYTVSTSISPTGTSLFGIFHVNNICNIINVDNFLVFVLNNVPVWKIYGDTGNFEVNNILVDPVTISNTQENINAYLIANNLKSITPDQSDNFTIKNINNNLLFLFGSTILMKLFNNGDLYISGNLKTNANILP